MFALLAVLLWLSIPEPAFAWGPGTHVALGELVLGSLYLLPPAVRAVLQRYPIHFLYGNVAADISFAKKYVPEGRHCHNWHVGEEIAEEAARTSEAMRAVALGYLAHLAADTVAHNLYVPRRLLLTSTTAAVGHTYWEHRMDVHVGEEYLGKARRLVFQNDHSEADALFDKVLSSTLFSFRTNRRLFRGMIQVQGDDRWIGVFDRILRRSRFDVPEALVHRYLALSYDSVVDYLRSRRQASPALLDPIGDLNLKLAKKVRRLAMARGGAADPAQLVAAADDFFPLPSEPLVFWPEMQRLGLELDPWEAPPPTDLGHAPQLATPDVNGAA
ncbi:MAG: zinc dependent phospholipase C family protein [Longimicrobiales bacterium]|nr:zinc dependent phospholipase C family protein [Longimicrobiales bacterium]